MVWRLLATFNGKAGSRPTIAFFSKTERQPGLTRRFATRAIGLDTFQHPVTSTGKLETTSVISRTRRCGAQRSAVLHSRKRFLASSGSLTCNRATHTVSPNRSVGQFRCITKRCSPPWCFRLLTAQRPHSGTGQNKRKLYRIREVLHTEDIPKCTVRCHHQCTEGRVIVRFY